MKKLKQILLTLPEYYLIVVVLFSWIGPTLNVNPIAIALIIMLTLQIIFKNKITGMIIASLFLLINIYMFFALVSEFREFPTFNADAKQLLFVGLLLFILNLLMAGLMIVKYAPKETSSVMRS